MLPAPEVAPLDQFTDRLDNIYVEWTPEDDVDITHYWVVSSYSQEFDNIQTCSLWDSGTGSCTIHLSGEDTIYCRVYSVDGSGRISDSAETVSTIADTTAPVLTSLTLAGGADWISDPRINIDFEGTDNINSSGCESILLVERDSSFSSGVREYPCGAFSGDLSFRVSAGYERKVIFARLVDRAGNRGAPLRAEVMYEEGAHCYPNPFNPARGEETSLVYRMGGPGTVRIYLYDRFGNLVFKETTSGGSGWNEFSWDGRNGRGEIVASGGYICVIDGEREYKCKVAVLK
jgi:hypothetical protein